MGADEINDSDNKLCWEDIEDVTRPEYRNNKVPHQSVVASEVHSSSKHGGSKRVAVFRDSVTYQKRQATVSSTTAKNKKRKKEACPGSWCSPGTGASYSEECGIISQIDKKTKSKIDRGKYKIDGTIDLHGCSLNAAYETLVDFIINSYQSGHKCVLIITGWGSKSFGTNSIKSSLYQWLTSDRLIKMVLYYTQAIATHGGKGAFYVLLRSKHKDKSFYN